MAHRFSTVLAVLLGFALAGQARALTFTLQELIDGGGFTTISGLTFGDFDATIAGDLALAVTSDDLLLTVLTDGFALTGPLSTADGEIGDVLLSFGVFAVSVATGINGASLLALGVADGNGAQAAVDELLLGLPGSHVLGVLSTFVTGATAEDGIFADAIQFAPQLSIRVRKDIVLDSFLIGGGPGGSARISFIEQRFTVVPEPGTLALLGIGLTGVGIFGRRRGFWIRPDVDPRPAREGSAAGH
jgi:hypothetical protein